MTSTAVAATRALGSRRGRSPFYTTSVDSIEPGVPPMPLVWVCRRGGRPSRPGLPPVSPCLLDVNDTPAAPSSSGIAAASRHLRGREPVSRRERTHQRWNVVQFSAPYGPSGNPGSPVPQRQKPPARDAARGLCKDLAATYFPTIRTAVSSARESLTAEFGMGSGVTSPPWPPRISRALTRI